MTFTLRLSAPTLNGTASIWFAAYAPGWGYAAYALSADTLRERLGAAGSQPQQLLLAFELGRQCLVRAIQARLPAPPGVRTTLTPKDL